MVCRKQDPSALQVDVDRFSQSFQMHHDIEHELSFEHTTFFDAAGLELAIGLQPLAGSALCSR